MPLSFIDSTICPFVNAVSLFFAHYVLPWISSPISPIIRTFSVHLILVPVSLETPSVGPSIITVALYISIIPDTAIARTIMPLVCSLSMFLSHHIFSVVFWTVLPGFNSTAMLLIIKPLTIIRLPTTRFHIDTLSMSLTKSVLSLISCTIGPRLLAIPVLEIVVPCSDVSGTALSSIRRPMLQQLRVNLYVLLFQVLSGSLVIKRCRVLSVLIVLRRINRPIHIITEQFIWMLLVE